MGFVDIMGLFLRFGVILLLVVLEFLFFSLVPEEMIPLSTKKHIRCPTPKMSDFLSERKLESG